MTETIKETWFTREDHYYPAYRMPLVCGNTLLETTELPHSDSILQLLIVTEGQITLDGSEGKTQVTAPAVCCIRGGMDGRQVRSRDAKLHHIVFQTSVINRRYADPRAIPGTQPDDFLEQIDYSMFAPFFASGSRISVHRSDEITVDRLQLLMGHLSSILENPSDEFWPCRSRSYFLEILLQVYRTSLGIHMMPVQDDGDRVTRVVSYLNAQFEAQHTLEGICRKFGTNRTTLNEQFNKRYGEPVMQHLTTIRLREACNLLRNTLLPVEEIAHRCGFGEPLRLWRCFRSRLSTTPSEYRNRFPSPY